MNQQLLILQCPDRSLWYRAMVGRSVPLLRNLPEGAWLSREPSGLTNIVRHGDASPLPIGFTAAPHDSLIQHGDLIHDGAQLHPARPDQLGHPVGRLPVVRRCEGAHA